MQRTAVPNESRRRSPPSIAVYEVGTYTEAGFNASSASYIFDFGMYPPARSLKHAHYLRHGKPVRVYAALYLTDGKRPGRCRNVHRRYARRKTPAGRIYFFQTQFHQDARGVFRVDVFSGTKSRKNLPTEMAVPGNPWILRATVACMFVAVALFALARIVAPPILNARISFLSSNYNDRCSESRDPWIPPAVADALLHYATTSVIPQQNRGEITLSLEVLAERSPCNFLVFGLGHDSTLWNALNYGGLTVFLEEDSGWISQMRRSHPNLKAHHVRYPTNLTQADSLLKYYSSDPSCSPGVQSLAGSRCKLALTNLPEQIYNVEWDVIMIDAPRGYFDAGPGRMTAIYTGAVMARNRKKDGITHIFLHDVDRRVEKMYAEEFLCRENLLGASGRLWHFGIKPLPASDRIASFCNKSPR